MWMLLVACELLPPADDPTVLRSLTVLDAVPTPAQVGPGERLTLEVVTVDPVGGPRDALVWACTPTEDGCVEAGPPALPLGAFSAVVRDAAPTFEVSWDVPVSVGPLLPEAGAATALGWVLVCRPGRCPLLDAVEADPSPGSRAWTDVVTRLADPIGAVEGVDLDEATLGLRRLVLTNDPVEVRRPGPSVVRIGGPLAVAPGGSLAVELVSVGAIEVWPYTTAGGWQFATYDLSGGATSMLWTAPETAGRYRVYGVVRDGYGGSAVWQEEVEVGP